MIRIPTFSGTGSFLVSLSSFNSQGNQLWYKRRNILNHHESFPGQIIVAHSAVTITEFIRELLPQYYVVPFKTLDKARLPLKNLLPCSVPST